jgi:hypothetical protein
LFDGAMGDRTQDLRIQARETGKLLSISVVALAVAVIDRPQLTHVRHDDLMAQFLQLLADPGSVRPRFHRNPCWRQISEPLRDGLRCCPETASTNDLSAFVEGAVVAPDIAKIDPDRHLDLVLSAWNFRDEMLRWLLQGNSLSDPKDLLIPFIVTDPPR